MLLDDYEFVPAWSPVARERQTLTCMHRGKSVGYVDLGIGGVSGEPPVIRLDMICVEPDRPYRHGVVSNWLIDTVVARWPDAVMMGGPVVADEDSGPSFRVRTWERGIGIHDPVCGLPPSGGAEPDCGCLSRARREASLRAMRISRIIGAEATIDDSLRRRIRLA